MTDLSEPHRIPSAALSVGLAGLVPFVVAASAQWITLTWVERDWALAAGMIYGAIVLSFTGGIRWGTAIGPYGSARQREEFGLSLIPPLAGWTALLLPSIPGLCLLMAGFLAQAMWDVTTVENGRLPPWFGKLRLGLTAGAVLSLIAMLVRVLLG